MLKKLSLRARLTILSAIVMISVSVVLTAVSMYTANRIFVQDLGQTLPLADITVTDGSGGVSFQPSAGSDVASFTPNDSPENGGVVNDGAPLADYSTFKLSLTQAGKRFNTWGIVGLIFVTLLGVGATWIMAGRALKPIRELSATIEEISGKYLSRRVDVQDRQDELGRLSHSFNRMMDKVSDSFERQKRFSASAAHELKTPLATIQVGLEVLDLDAEPDPERMKKALTVTRTHTSRMIRLMDDLFRLSSDDLTEMNEEVSVRELFTEVLTELSPSLRQKNLVASADAAPDIILSGNRTLLYRVLFNLAENAVKYNRQDGSISLSATEEEDAVIIKISDTGIGIPLEDQKHIFEPFYRVDRSRSRAMGGSGLGLSLVHDIIEKHGGSIEIESTLGKGTTFTLYLPK